MGISKRKGARPTQPARPRATRSKGIPLADPGENTQQLTQQLRALGLYAAPTLGDGNCLFRALSDQLYGSPTRHSQLRQAICDWIESHKQRYAPFVDDERGLDVHLQCMRQQATYGGHLELSAFAHMTQRNVKVIQPGLVYVIEWDAGGDTAPEPSTSSGSSMSSRGESPDGGPLGPIYVAYHDWEHFSSIRNLRGPHAGLPNIREIQAEDQVAPPTPSKKPVSKAKSRASSKPLSKATSSRASSPLTSISTEAAPTPPLPSTPSQIPLPASRSPSPTSLSTPPVSLRPNYLPAVPSSLSRTYHSPKRTFDESSASSEDSQSAAKRARSSTRPLGEGKHGVSGGARTPLSHTELAPDVQVDADDAEDDTPSLSGPGSPASSSSLSSAPSPEPSPPPPPPERLTRRQRKQRGLPKPRIAQVASARGSPGKIVIPGGRYKKSYGGARGKVNEDGEEDEEEWQRNGTGRVDVRGFRELRI